MKIQYYILFALLAFNCNVAFTQEIATNYEALYEKELLRQDSLNSLLQELKVRQKQLLEITGADNSKLTKKIDSKRKVLESKEAEYTKLINSPAYKKLQDLHDEQKKLESQIATLADDTLNVFSSISNLENQIKQLSGNVEELESIKTDVRNQLVEENQSTLKKPFSQLTLDELNTIKTKCSKYSTDQKINALIGEAENVLNNKRIYDEAILIINSKFNKSNLVRINQKIANMKDINSAQQSEINAVRGKLSHFEPGMLVFKEFIVKLNKCRDGATNYSKDDLKDDLKRIFAKDNLRERIESEIFLVPYLAKTFNEYINTIKAKPMSHPEIETEILNYSN